MFGHDNKDENNDKKNIGDIIQPISTKPVDEKLLGVNDDLDTVEEKTTIASSDSDDKELEDIVNGINGSTSADSGDDVTPMITKHDDDEIVVADDNDEEEEKTNAPELPEAEEEKKEDKPMDDLSDDTIPTIGNSDGQPSDELLDIKKSALRELSPLIDQLDQTAEEKTNIILMTIQATDDKSLVSNAFKAAKEIKDDKKRAQAMLDIINEINYFTQKQK